MMPTNFNHYFILLYIVLKFHYAYEVLASRGSSGIDPSTDECLENLGTFEKHKNMFYKIQYENRPALPKTVDAINFDGLGSLGLSLNGLVQLIRTNKNF